MLYPEQLLKEHIDKLASEVTKTYQAYLMKSVAQISKAIRTTDQYNEEYMETVLDAFGTPQYRIDAFSLINRQQKIGLYKFNKLVDWLLEIGKLQRDYNVMTNGHPKIVRVKENT